LMGLWGQGVALYDGLPSTNSPNLGGRGGWPPAWQFGPPSGEAGDRGPRLRLRHDSPRACWGALGSGPAKKTWPRTVLTGAHPGPPNGAVGFFSWDHCSWPKTPRSNDRARGLAASARGPKRNGAGGGQVGSGPIWPLRMSASSGVGRTAGLRIKGGVASTSLSRGGRFDSAGGGLPGGPIGWPPPGGTLGLGLSMRRREGRDAHRESAAVFFSCRLSYTSTAFRGGEREGGKGETANGREKTAEGHHSRRHACSDGPARGPGARRPVRRRRPGSVPLVFYFQFSPAAALPQWGGPPTSWTTGTILAGRGRGLGHAEKLGASGVRGFLLTASIRRFNPSSGLAEVSIRKGNPGGPPGGPGDVLEGPERRAVLIRRQGFSNRPREFGRHSTGAGKEKRRTGYCPPGGPYATSPTAPSFGRRGRLGRPDSFGPWSNATDPIAKPLDFRPGGRAANLGRSCTSDLSRLPWRWTTYAPVSGELSRGGRTCPTNLGRKKPGARGLSVVIPVFKRHWEKTSTKLQGRGGAGSPDGCSRTQEGSTYEIVCRSTDGSQKDQQPFSSP